MTDVKHDAIAVREAQKSKIKIIGLVDSNSNPEGLDFPIPSNDDATKAIELMCRAIAEAVTEGRQSQSVVKEEAAVEKTA